MARIGPWAMRKLARIALNDPAAARTMAEADFDAVPSLAAAMGLLRCIHGEEFPCAQCKANRKWNEAATGRKLTEAEFEARYAAE